MKKAWREVNGQEATDEFERKFQAEVNTRSEKRSLAQGEGAYCAETLKRLQDRADELHQRLKEEYNLPLEQSMLTPAAIRSRLAEIKNISPRVNVILLCGGIAPEVAALKRLGVPLGIVIVQDTDLEAVGVAVAAHPDVHFAIVGTNVKNVGDIKAMTEHRVVRLVEIEVGGTHAVCLTSPCTAFSLCGKKEGFDGPAGLLFIQCKSILDQVQKCSGEMPMYLVETVYSTKILQQEQDSFFGLSNLFKAKGSMCAPSERKRRFATNRPPVVCRKDIDENDVEDKELPSLNGDLPEYCAAAAIQGPDRQVPPDRKKFPCLMFSKPCVHLVWERTKGACIPTQTMLLPEEAERAMGYSGKEIGITKHSAKQAIQERIDAHDFKDGRACVIHLNGCGDDKTKFREVPDSRRIQLLGNSQIVTLLEALMWNDRQRFPGIEQEKDD